MKIGRTSSRWALWLFAAALLLKAAMPLLASVSAQAQGKAVVEVCTVFGVSLVPLDAPDHSPAPEQAGDHRSDHCALTGLASMAVPAPAALAAAPAAAQSPLPAPAALAAPVGDPFARWAARLRHGPPALA